MRVAVLAAALTLGPAAAEPDTQVFHDVEALDPGRAGEASVVVRLLGFMEDNEYVNEIADAYTLFGTRLSARLRWHPHADVRLEAGATLLHLFGDARAPALVPFLRFKYETGAFAFVFGHLEGHLAHGLIEPLFDFERHLTRPFETGFQLRWASGRVFADLWLDWVTLIRAGDPHREEVHAGLSTSFTVVRAGGLELMVPLQITAVHLGGSIDSSPEPVETLFDGATGARVRATFEGRLEALEIAGYLVGYTDWSISHTPLFERGWGVYASAGVHLSILGQIELAYWRGEAFVAPMGGALFSSVSRRVNRRVDTERVRELVILRLVNDIELAPGVTLSLRAEPHYDVQNRQPEFSTGLYVVYRDELAIARPRSERSPPR